MLADQNGVCAICRLPPTGRRKYLTVDHCHLTGRIRGLLHVKCNSAIGNLNDDPELLRSALDYLERADSKLVAISRTAALIPASKQAKVG